MVINVSVQYKGGLLPDIYYTVNPMLLSSGNPMKCHEEVLPWQLVLPPTINNLMGCSEDLDAFRFLFKQIQWPAVNTMKINYSRPTFALFPIIF